MLIHDTQGDQGILLDKIFSIMIMGGGVGSSGGGMFVLMLRFIFIVVLYFYDKVCLENFDCAVQV